MIELRFCPKREVTSERQIINTFSNMNSLEKRFHRDSFVSSKQINFLSK